MKKTFSLLVSSFLVFMFVSAACAQSENMKEYSPEEFHKILKSDTSLVVLDVRTPPELTGPLGKIDKAINIPVQELAERVHELDKYKGKEIAVICRTGHRSSMGTKILLENGFNAVNVQGGMTQFRNLEKPKE